MRKVKALDLATDILISLEQGECLYDEEEYNSLVECIDKLKAQVKKEFEENREIINAKSN